MHWIIWKSFVHGDTCVHAWYEILKLSLQDLCPNMSASTDKDLKNSRVNFKTFAQH